MPATNAPTAPPTASSSSRCWRCGHSDDLQQLYGDPVGIWRSWALHVTGYGIESGHHMAEEAPAELAKSLQLFLCP